MRRTVLIVDDNEHNREYARQVLEVGFDVRVAIDGAAALASIAEATPDLVVLDLSMPHLDGWEVLRRLRAGEAGDLGARLQVVACTAHAMAGDRERILAHGFDAYLPKPYRPDELAACVEAFLGGGEAAEDDGWGGDGWSLDDEGEP